jgi:mitochondrial fission protein ELM1
MKRQIWIISEGSPGHVAQSEGLVNAIKNRIECDIVTYETRHKFGGFIRTLIRRWMGTHGKSLPDWCMCRLLGVETYSEVRPDLIVASGGKAVFAAVSMARATSAKLVYLGERKPYPSAWFDLVLTPSPSEHGTHDVSVDLIPTAMSPKRVNEAAVNWTERPSGKLWSMIIGGASPSHRYQESDWVELSDAMNQSALANNIRWLVSTSRRTGRHAEQILKSRLDTARIADAVWWSDGPKKTLARYIGSSEQVFVTQDSVTMVTEAVNAGKIVVVVQPREIRHRKGSFLSGYFDRLEVKHRIARVGMHALAKSELLVHQITPITTPVEDELAAIVIAKFKLSS